MRTYYLIRRNIPGGGNSGEIVDTTDWLHTHLLIGTHHLEAIDNSQATKAPKCICGRQWMDKEHLVNHQASCEKARATAPVPEPQPAA